MFALTPTLKVKRAIDCTGPEEEFEERTQRVELCDVGTTLDHFGGHKVASYTFTQEDVGRHIREVKQGYWYYCWYFLKERS